MSTAPHDSILKRPRSPKPPSSPNKRICKPTTTPDIQTILHLSEDAIFSLPKSELRSYFLALRQYALNPHPLSQPDSTVPLRPTISSSSSSSATTTIPSPSPTPTCPLLALPLEIRLQIYTYTLAPALPAPLTIPGPHPRQLQSPLLLTQRLCPALLALSRQIRAEALPVCWGAPAQLIHIPVGYDIWTHKTRRSALVLPAEVRAAIRHVHVIVHLGSEKVRSRPEGVEREGRLGAVRKGVGKVGKWLSGADIQLLRVSWQEPPQTYTWEQKREILVGLKALGAVKVEVGEINWGLGLNWNKGRKYRFEIEYLKELERGTAADAG